MENIGDKLNSIVNYTMHKLFEQGESAQLVYQALSKYIEEIESSKDDKITISYPVGYNAKNETITGNKEYTKEEIKDKYAFLANTQLAINRLYQIVTLIEVMFIDILREVFLKYPDKISSKKQVSMSVVLKSKSIKDIHLQTINKLLNEFSYKSPKDFLEEFQKITSINLLETPSFHKYLEIKATRDILIHNMGIANEIYIEKSGSHARVKNGIELPINPHYFLESYESCLQLCEFLEKGLHIKWHSMEYESKTNAQLEKKKEPIPGAI